MVSVEGKKDKIPQLTAKIAANPKKILRTFIELMSFLQKHY
jgi:hypothetical protein